VLFCKSFGQNVIGPKLISIKHQWKFWNSQIEFDLCIDNGLNAFLQTVRKKINPALNSNCADRCAVVAESDTWEERTHACLQTGYEPPAGKNKKYLQPVHKLNLQRDQQLNLSRKHQLNLPREHKFFCTAFYSDCIQRFMQHFIRLFFSILFCFLNGILFSIFFIILCGVFFDFYSAF